MRRGSSRIIIIPFAFVAFGAIAERQLVEAVGIPRRLAVAQRLGSIAVGRKQGVDGGADLGGYASR